MVTLNLNGAWRVRPARLSTIGETGCRRVLAQRSGWLRATVPGEIHLDLMRAGQMPEPLVSNHAPQCRWPERHSWWYRTTFRAADRLRACERQELVFDGLDLYAQVFLNGVLLGEAANAFVPARFDVRHRLRSGRNQLVVRLTAGAERVPPELQPRPADPRQVYGGRGRFPGISQLRKPQFTYGWDWVDALPNIGIWRGVRLEGRSGIVLHDLRLDPVIEGERVFVDLYAVVENLHPWSERRGALEVTLTPPTGRPIRCTLTTAAQVGHSVLTQRLEIRQPRLWWPNGMGDQPLYRVMTRVLTDGRLADQRELEIGLRTVSLDRSPDRTGGSRFCLRVNGQVVFCKGGNWIPADAILARVSPAKYQRLVTEARQAHLNMLRIWGGGVYEDPVFYAACDRAGILIWQDFMFACAQYPDHDPGFRQRIRAEAETVVMALRHHPCIALWCGNNENIWGFAQWWNAGKTADDPQLGVGGSRLYNQVLPEVCRSLDPQRPYWPSSPCGGALPNDEMAGDCHWWHGCTMNADMERRIRHEVFDECRARFVSEYGVIGPCHLDSVRQFLRPEERQVGSRAWRAHTNQFEKETTPAAIRRHYAEPEGLAVADYILYGQLFQATLYGRSLEALRFRKGDRRDDCQGALIWMFDDCWGETGWTPIDYYLRRKPSYYWIRRACAPVRAIVRRRGRHLVTRVVNDTLQPVEVLLCGGWLRVDGSRTRVAQQRVTVPANQALEAMREPIPAPRVQDPRQWLYAAWLEDGDPDPSIWTLVPHRSLELPATPLTVQRLGTQIAVTSPVYAHAVHYPDRGRALLSDNYFDLLPGVPKRLRWLTPTLPRELTFRAVPTLTPRSPAG